MGFVKKQKDRKYQKSDKKICDFGNEVMEKESRKIDIKNAEIYRGAQVSRATFSRHYRNITDMKVREERTIMEQLRRKLKKDDDQKTAILKLMLLIHKNREVFRVLVKRNDVFLTKKMVSMVNEIVMRNWRSYGRKVDKEIERRCIYEVMAVIESWAENEFSEKLLEEKVMVVNEIYNHFERYRADFAKIYVG